MGYLTAGKNWLWFAEKWEWHCARPYNLHVEVDQNASTSMLSYVHFLSCMFTFGSGISGHLILQVPLGIASYD